MALFGTLRKSKLENKEKERIDRGFFVFENTSEVIQAENILKKHGWAIRVMGLSPIDSHRM